MFVSIYIFTSGGTEHNLILSPSVLILDNFFSFTFSFRSLLCSTSLFHRYFLSPVWTLMYYPSLSLCSCCIFLKYIKTSSRDRWIRKCQKVPMRKQWTADLVVDKKCFPHSEIETISQLIIFLTFYVFSSTTLINLLA